MKLRALVETDEELVVVTVHQDNLIPHTRGFKGALQESAHCEIIHLPSSDRSYPDVAMIYVYGQIHTFAELAFLPSTSCPAKPPKRLSIATLEHQFEAMLQTF